MPLTPQDRDLIRRCLHHEAGAWNEFVQRYLGLVYHVITHTAHLRSYPIRADETEDIAASHDFFDLVGDSLLATRVLSALARATGEELTMDDFLMAPTPELLAARVGAADGVVVP